MSSDATTYFVTGDINNRVFFSGLYAGLNYGKPCQSFPSRLSIVTVTRHP